MADIYEGGAGATLLLEQAAALLATLAASGAAARSGFTHIREIIGQYLTGTLFRDASAPGEQRARLSTGYPALDALLGGLHRSDLVIVAARPGVGKSALALGFARNAALRERAHVAVFSLEMSSDQLVERLLAAEAAVDVSRLRTGGHRHAELEAVLNAAGKLSEAEILFADTPTVTLAEMRARALRLHAERPLDLLIVDYLQLIADGGGRGR
ncbi:MAG: DnaB-like helicase C-terminal domain-containing protein, partial [Chloroflexi bacterium]|nr:DnaB-like helicase C-terminal domain-containing protein [Chloroflexota bacterium]